MIIVFTLVFALYAQFANTSSAAPKYSARLVTPRAGQVVYPGQVVRVEWTSILPVIDPSACETEVWLSLDGGRTYTSWISPWIAPTTRHFDWTVPNTPTSSAVMDIRFGCEPGWPETYAPQSSSTFVIAKPADW